MVMAWRSSSSTSVEGTGVWGLWWSLGDWLEEIAFFEAVPSHDTGSL